MAVVMAMTTPILTMSAAAQSPNLGKSLSAQDIAQIDYFVQPDGQGLPVGSGNAKTGAGLYQMHCLACHGTAGEQGINDRLAGGHGSIDTDSPVKTVGSYWPYATTVFDYLRRAMPYTAPGSLSADEIYALTAYLLFINGIVEEGHTLNAGNLPQVSMPNAENFVWAVSAD
jgi:cytochrome c